MQCIHCDEYSDIEDLGDQCPHCGWIVSGTTRESGGMRPEYKYISEMYEGHIVTEEEREAGRRGCFIAIIIMVILTAIFLAIYFGGRL